MNIQVFTVTNIQRQQKHRMEIIRETLQKDCVEKCSGNWYRCALEIFQGNNVESVAFAAAMRELITQRRWKFRNILIVETVNCCKTFSLSPLRKNTFSKSTNDKYTCVGAEKAEIILLNNIRWLKVMIAWKGVLILLEFQAVHLPSPKNHYSNDICNDKDFPIVDTSKGEITYVRKYNSLDTI